MASPTLSDIELAKQFGRRSQGQPLFEPCEWGYRCPNGHRGQHTTWSEFNKHIWCHKCNLEFPSETCPMQRPSWMTPQQFKEMVSKLPFKPKVLRGVDHCLDLMDRQPKPKPLGRKCRRCE